MQEKLLSGDSFRDFSKGTWNSIQSSLAPKSSVKIAINMDSDVELGSFVTRNGLTILEDQVIAGNRVCLGLHQFRQSVGSSHKVFAVFPDGTNNDIYDVETGLKSLEDDTVNLETNFLTYLDSCLRLNGTDDPKAWNGSAWVTTGGAFDLSNMPGDRKLCIEWHDRVWIGGYIGDPDRVDYSSIADPSARSVSWTADETVGSAGYIYIEQEDGGGGMTAFAKVPGYLIFFKKRTMKRYDGASTFPDDMFSQGAPSQKAVCMAHGYCFFVNENGAWVTTGGQPKKISTFTVDNIIQSVSAANMLNVNTWADDEHLYVSLIQATVSGEVRNNVVLKYNILLSTWDVRIYTSQTIRIFSDYVDANESRNIICADADGTVFKLNEGNTDNLKPINWTVETHDLDFGYRMHEKTLNRIGVLTENVNAGEVMYRINNNSHKEWKPGGTFASPVSEIDTANIRGNFFNLKFTGIVNSGQSKFLGWEVPDESVTVYDNSVSS